MVEPTAVPGDEDDLVEAEQGRERPEDEDVTDGDDGAGPSEPPD